MKMLLITAVESYEKDVVELLKSSHINAFSSTPIQGHVNHQDPHLEDNWFGGSGQEQRSMLFFSLVSNKHVDEVFEKIEAFNAKQESKSKIHLSILNVDKSN
jgi:hypothetical protein